MYGVTGETFWSAQLPLQASTRRTTSWGFFTKESLRCRPGGWRETLMSVETLAPSYQTKGVHLTELGQREELCWERELSWYQEGMAMPSWAAAAGLAPSASLPMLKELFCGSVGAMGVVPPPWA